MACLSAERHGLPAGYFRMETPDAYRKFAEECRRLAVRAEMGEQKIILQEMARIWAQLAAQAEADDSLPD
jgi:hypothetical protein